jgi:diaminopimelate decarboxylase
MSLSNQKLLEIASTYGSPVYIYDTQTIIEQYQKLTSAFTNLPSKFFYACKALSNINILQLIKSIGCGLDCVSINEVKLGLMLGFHPENIIYTPNCVDFEEVDECKNLGVNINIDNISVLEQFGTKYGSSYPIGIRINPHIMAGGNLNIATGHIDSKFGISIHQIRHLQRVVASTGLIVKGLHMHTGSEIKDVEVFIRSLEILLELTQYFPKLSFLDLGSGFKVPYTADDDATDLQQLALRIKQTITPLNLSSNPDFELWFEPGKFLVSAAGYFLTKANVIKHTPATTFVGMNSGFNHFIRPMFYAAYHHISNVSNPNGTPRIYTVVGNLCETDTFAYDRKISQVHEGDYLVFHNAGAYGYEMSSNFNSRTRPAEVMVHQGVAYLIRQQDTFEDLVKQQINCKLF